MLAPSSEPPQRPVLRVFGASHSRLAAMPYPETHAILPHPITIRTSTPPAPTFTIIRDCESITTATPSIPNTPNAEPSKANKENSPISVASSSSGKKKRPVVCQAGVTKCRAPLASKVAKNAKTRLTLEMVGDQAEQTQRGMEEATAQGILQVGSNRLAQELTQLPLGDISAGYEIQMPAQD